jgi:gamma-glutamylcyclotransferase
MLYFSYGSNMSLARMQGRLPDARQIGAFELCRYALRFHKPGLDESAKCDAYWTGSETDAVHGVVYELSSTDKRHLDKIEGLGVGYAESEVVVVDSGGVEQSVMTYVATQIDPTLSPFQWYKRHVLIGASLAGLPGEYILAIAGVPAVDDSDLRRAARELAIHRMNTPVCGPW